MPTPPGQPQGFARGGQVGYADGGKVNNYMEGYWEKYFPGLLQGAERAKMAVAKVPLTLTAAPGLMAAKDMMNFIPAGQEGYRPLYLSDEHAALDVKIKERQKNAEKMAAALEAPGVAPPAYLLRGDAPVAENVPTEVSVPAPVSHRPGPLSAPAPAGGMGGYTTTAVGIGSIDPHQALAGSAPSGGVAPAAGMPNPYNVSPEELALQQFLKNDENFKLPEALSYQAFIDEAVGEEQKIREEAKRQAIGAALVQLGAGLASGDMAKGFTTAGAESRDILSQGRKEASAQKALAQQFKLQGMQGERDVKLKQMDMDLKRTEGLATLVGGNRRAAEERAMQIARMQQDASQHAASIGVQYGQLQISAERAVLEKKQGAMQFMENLIETSGIKAPTQARLDEWAIANRTNPATAGPNPMDTYMAQRAAAAKLAAPKVERVYGIPAQDLYIDAVKPVSNSGGTRRKQVGQFIVDY